MKTSIFILIFISLTIFQVGVNSQPIKYLGQNLWLSMIPGWYIDGIYYYDGYFLYNTTNHQLTQTKLAPCVGGFFITANEMVWCLDQGEHFNYTLYQVNLDVTEVLGSWPIPNVPKPQINMSIEASGYSINLFFTGYFISFNTYTKEFSCQIHNETLLGAFGYFLNSSIVVSHILTEPTVTTFSCKGEAPIVNQASGDLLQYIFFSFNQTTILARSLVSETYSEIYSAGLYDLTGRVYFGQNFYQDYGVQLNDTHMIFVNSEGVGLYVITSSLTFELVQNYPLNITNNALELAPFQGVAQTMVYFTDGGFWLDLDNQVILEAFSQYPPIVFNNGSVVNITINGYFIQNPGENINFYGYQLQDIYVNASEPSIIYGLFIRNISSSTTSICQALYINGQSNIIEIVNLAQCSAQNSSQGSAKIRDVTFEASGDLVLSYTDQLKNLYILTTSQLIGPINLLNTIGELTVSVNLETQTVTFGGFNNTSKNQFVGGYIDLSTQKIVNSTTFPGGQNNYVQKLTQNYYMGMSSFANTSVSLFVWNTTSLSKANQIIFKSSCVAGVPLGISEENEWIYTAVICQNGFTGLDLISSGKAQFLNIQNVWDINPVSNDTVAFYLMLENYDGQAFYQLTEN